MINGKHHQTVWYIDFILIKTTLTSTVSEGLVLVWTVIQGWEVPPSGDILQTLQSDEAGYRLLQWSSILKFPHADNVKNFVPLPASNDTLACDALAYPEFIYNVLYNVPYY